MQFLGLLSLILIFFAKSIIAKQFEYSRIKHMCIFHVLTVRGSRAVRGLPCRVQRESLFGYAPNEYFNSLSLSFSPTHTTQVEENAAEEKPTKYIVRPPKELSSQYLKRQAAKQKEKEERKRREEEEEARAAVSGYCMNVCTLGPFALSSLIPLLLLPLFFLILSFFNLLLPSSSF